MRIGLLTYHHVVNIGSVLQTYCSYNLLTQLFPQAQVEIIDHVPAVSEAFKARHRKVTKAKGLFAKDVENEFILTERAYDRFLRQRCKHGPRLGVTNDHKAVMEAITQAGYDVVFVGSDTVFQLDGYFGEPIADDYPPNAYYLPGLRGPKKVGLAVSFDPYTDQPKERDKLSEVATLLQAFDHVLYRDSTAEGLLRDAGYPADRMGHIPDPTVMMDITHLVPPGGAGRSADALPKAGVAVADERLLQHVRQALQEAGYDVLDYMHPPNQVTDAVDPATVVGNALNGYRELDLMVTDRFHGSILTLQVSDANVIGIENAGRYSQPNSKLRDLYERLGIGDHLIRCGSEGPDPAVFSELLKKRSWDRAIMMQRMATLRAQGFASVSAALSAL